MNIAKVKRLDEKKVLSLKSDIYDTKACVTKYLVFIVLIFIIFQLILLK